MLLSVSSFNCGGQLVFSECYVERKLTYIQDDEEDDINTVESYKYPEQPPGGSRRE